MSTEDVDVEIRRETARNCTKFAVLSLKNEENSKERPSFAKVLASRFGKSGA